MNSAADPRLCCRFRKQLEHPRLHGHVKRARRLVCNEQHRIQRECARERGPLSLPAGELVREAFPVGPRQLHRLEQFIDALLRATNVAGETVHDEGLSDVLGDGEQRIETRSGILEHETDLLAQRFEAALLEPDHRRRRDHRERSARCVGEPRVAAADLTRLASPRLTHQAKHFARSNIEVDPANCGEPRTAEPARVLDLQPACAHDRCAITIHHGDRGGTRPARTSGILPGSRG